MVEYNSFVLDNGLKIFVHEDNSTEIAVLNTMYDVGARDENPEKTGFAHLFEHLMFGGSKNIPSYDEPLQKVGGENNAFTTHDITNYYLTIPAVNLETGFWLESDRMLSLSFDPHVLKVQRKVVIEEFKQHYLNQPYGDVWSKLRQKAYSVHPYRWPTIGKEINHIEQASMEDVKDFFFRFYRPNNAVISVAGNVRLKEVKRLAEKWFAPIPPGNPYNRKLAKEPIQTSPRLIEISSDVPTNAFYKAFHMSGHIDKEFHATELMSDILGGGDSSRLYQCLVKDKKLFNSVGSYITGSMEPGLIVVSGKLHDTTDMKDAELAVNEVVNRFVVDGASEEELEKVKNAAESTWVFSQVELLYRAINICYGQLLGQPEFINEELAKIKSVTMENIRAQSKSILKDQNSTTLRYYKT